jgi:hypothetical protein
MGVEIYEKKIKLCILISTEYIVAVNILSGINTLFVNMNSALLKRFKKSSKICI